MSVYELYVLLQLYYTAVVVSYRTCVAAGMQFRYTRYYTVIRGIYYSCTSSYPGPRCKFRNARKFQFYCILGSKEINIGVINDNKFMKVRRLSRVNSRSSSSRMGNAAVPQDEPIPEV